MLLLNLAFPEEGGPTTLLIDPAAIQAVFATGDPAFVGATRVSTQAMSAYVTDTPADIAKLRVLWNWRGSDAFRTQFNLDRETYSVASIGWQRDGGKLILDIIDIAEQLEAEVTP